MKKRELPKKKKKKLKGILKKLSKRGTSRELMKKKGNSFWRWLKICIRKRWERLLGKMEVLNTRNFGPATLGWWGWNTYKRPNKWQQKREGGGRVQTRSKRPINSHQKCSTTWARKERKGLQWALETVTVSWAVRGCHLKTR